MEVLTRIPDVVVDPKKQAKSAKDYELSNKKKKPRNSVEKSSDSGRKSGDSAKKPSVQVKKNSSGANGNGKKTGSSGDKRKSTSLSKKSPDELKRRSSTKFKSSTTTTKGESGENFIKIKPSLNEDLKLKMRSDDFHSPIEINKDQMELLKQIVAQTELDRKLFCIFDNHKYIAQPVREELFIRGWLEYRPDKASIPRKARHVTPPVPGQPPPASGPPPPKVDHTLEAVGDLEKRRSTFHITPPASARQSNNLNEDILSYSQKNDVVHHDLNKMRKSSLYHPSLSPDEVKFVSALIQEANAKINLVWMSAKPDIQLQHFGYLPEVANKFQKTTFCSKYGLWFNLRFKDQLPKNIRYPVQTPRMYNLGDNQSYEDFVFDFHMTAVMSLLRWLATRLSTDGLESIQDEHGKVPLRVFEYAVKKGNLFSKYLASNGKMGRDEVMRSSSQWVNFIHWFYKIVNEGAKLKPTPTPQLYLVHCRAVEILRAVRIRRPEMDSDGTMNLWIVKPYSNACGRGIFMTNNIFYMERLNSKRYIIQKYIEKPYLIAQTKFDIRQWFMVTSLRPLHVWMYNDCYLRFCTLPFNLRNLHESVHLSNNAIQRKYIKDVSLPHQNMWDSSTFKNFLKENGYPDLWRDRIFPGMRDAIASALLCSQFTFDGEGNQHPPQKGWFEIYGADFMLTNNLRDGPWLIEINESPAMDPSTPVTGHLVNKMLRDVIKVVVDHRRNPKADTGGWVLAYQQVDVPRVSAQIAPDIDTTPNKIKASLQQLGKDKLSQNSSSRKSSKSTKSNAT